MASKLRIEYFVSPDGATLAARAAGHLVELAEEAVAARGRVRMAVSGGSTPKAVFALLADVNKPWYRRMPWEKLELFWVDERCVPPDHAESNYRMSRSCATASGWRAPSCRALTWSRSAWATMGIRPRSFRTLTPSTR